MPIKQDDRMLGIKTALGAEKLAIGSFTLQEQISRLFQIEAELATEDGEIKLDDVIGQKATIRLDIGDNDKRYFNGYVSRLVQVANEGHYARYRATIVPWLWFLTRTSDCRIFQNKTVPKIIEDIFQLYGFSDYKLKLSATYPTWEYCVQYRETAFNFVSRLMEQEGIYYYFEHEDGNHTLVLADSISAHKPFPGYADIAFHELGEGADEREVITDWTVEKEVQPVAYALQDFDFKKPKTSLLSSANVSRQYGKAEYEIYDFPGEYLEHDEGQRLSDVRLNELQSQYELLHGQASARGLAAGCIFKLKDHPRGDQNRDYLITEVSIQADSGPFDTSSGGESFSCSLSAIDKSQQFRAARLTPKPIVQGPQTAIVVGPSGEEIYTDEHARVKVHFPWDRHDKSDQDSSCWVRVSQYWAGKQWGSIHIPRIGQEVIVEFLEGDPDEPIITGRVYNADQVPPYALPANKTQSGHKSRSSKGGSTANFNEIRFEDKKGSEEVYIHAEKDQNNVVENDETTQVGHDRTEAVGHDEKITIGNDRTETVGRNEKTQVNGFHEETIAGSQTILVGANLNEKVALNYSETVGVAMEITVGAAMAITVGAAMAESVGLTKVENIGSSKTETIGGNKSTTVGKNLSKTVGKNQTLKVGADLAEEVGGQHKESVTKEFILQAKKVQITAEDEISIKTGDAEITMKKNGDISIQGNKINVKGSGDVTIKGSKIAEN
jgi:type VI secretion system secreted protein VgrG